MGAAQPTAERLTSSVNPFIGTGGHGHTYPGPSLPFGMIQPGPDTRLTGWDGCSGYHYSDARIFGFSHTHLSGTGIPDYADILLMPTTGDVRLNNGADGKPGYSSAFSHDDEMAVPGYYAVTLKDYSVRAELTTTTRVGIHRYTFPSAQPAHVVLDLEHRDQLLESALDIVSDTEVAGLRRSTGWARDQVVYFVIRFSRPFSGGAAANATPPTKRAFDFGSAGGTLLVKVGISAVSVEGARKNLDAEVPGWDFDAVRHAADAAWERELSKVTVEGGTKDDRIRFYTSLYHAMLTPNVYMDVDGLYRGRDGKTHKAEGFTYYTVFSLWDTFRALHPLLAVIDRARTRDFVQTFLRQYQEGGRLPVWELAANETDTMIGYHAVPVIADAIAKGIDGFDRALAFEAMTHSADEDRFGLAGYKRNGFIDGRDEAESVSRTLEYVYDDWTIAQVAGQAWPAGRLRQVPAPRAILQASLRSIGRLHARPPGRFLGNPVRSRRGQQPLHGGERLAVQLLRAAGRRGAHAADGRRRRVRAEARRTLFRGHQDDGTRAGGHYRSDRPVRARQRAQPSHGLPLRVRRSAMEDAGHGAAHSRDAVWNRP